MLNLYALRAVFLDNADFSRGDIVQLAVTIWALSHGG